MSSAVSSSLAPLAAKLPDSLELRLLNWNSIRVPMVSDSQALAVPMKRTRLPLVLLLVWW